MVTLRAERDLWQRIIDDGPTATLIVNHEGLITYANGVAENSLQLFRSEITGRTYNDPDWAITAVDGTPIRDDELPFAIIARTRKPLYGYEHAIRSADNSRRILRINGRPLSDSGQGAGSIVLTFEDVTAEFEAERARTRLNAYNENNADLTVILDQRHRVVEANRAFLESFGFASLEAVRNKSAADLFPGSDDPILAIQAREADAIRKLEVGNYLEKEQVVRLQDGREGVFRVRMFPLPGRLGDPVQVGIIASDISDLKRSETQLRQREALYKGLTEDIPLMICSCFPDGRIGYANPAFLAFFGKTKTALARMTFMNLVQENGETSFDQLGKGLSEATPQCSLDATAVNHQGETCLIHWIFRGVFNQQGQLAEIRCLGEDITQEKETQRSLSFAREDALNASQAKSDFLASMSHEIRTPLNGIIGMTEYLRSRPLDDDDQQCVSIIYQSGNILLELINDILDFSKIEAGRLELEADEVDLEASLLKVAELMQERADAKSLNLEVSLRLKNPIYCLDFARLRQVIINLLGNAIKFTRRGGDIRLEVVGKPEGGLDFAVTDTGIGISGEKLGKLFEPFVQADGSVNEKFGGTGLGLSICRRIVRAMGGDISVESVPDKGSRFFFRLPYAPIDGLPKPQGGGDPEASESTYAGWSAVVLDDDTTNSAVVVKLLERHGLTVVFLSTVASFLQAVKASSYDLYFIDLNMPRKSGLQLAQEIRGGEVEGVEQDAYLLAYTASATTKVRERCRTVGFNDYLSKPVTREHIRIALEKAEKARG